MKSFKKWFTFLLVAKLVKGSYPRYTIVRKRNGVNDGHNYQEQMSSWTPFLWHRSTLRAAPSILPIFTTSTHLLIISFRDITSLSTLILHIKWKLKKVMRTLLKRNVSVFMSFNLCPRIFLDNGKLPSHLN